MICSKCNNEMKLIKWTNNGKEFIKARNFRVYMYNCISENCGNVELSTNLYEGKEVEICQ